MSAFILRIVRLVIVVAWAAVPAAATVTVSTTTPTVDHEGLFQRVGSIRFIFSSDEFPAASRRSPKFIRIQLTGGARLAVTLAEGDPDNPAGVAPPGRCQPIPLVVESDGTPASGGFPTIEADAVELFRARRGENFILIRINDSTSDWGLSFVTRARFTIGVPPLEASGPSGELKRQFGTVLCIDYLGTPQFDPASAATTFNFIGIDAVDSDMRTQLGVSFDPATPAIATAGTARQPTIGCSLLTRVRQTQLRSTISGEDVICDVTARASSIKIAEGERNLFENSGQILGGLNLVAGGKLVLTLSVGTFIKDKLPKIAAPNNPDILITPIPTGRGFNELPDQGAGFRTAVYKLEGLPESRNAPLELEVSEFDVLIEDGCDLAPQDLILRVSYELDESSLFTCTLLTGGKGGTGCPRLISVSCSLTVGQLVASPTEGVLAFPLARATARADAFTGLSIVNPLTVRARAALTARDLEGNLIRQAGATNPTTVRMPQRTQLVSLAPEVFRFSAAPGLGSIRAKSDVDGVFGLFAFLDADLSRFDSAPVSSGLLRKNMILPLLDVRPGGVRALQLINPNPTAATAFLELLNFSGRLISSRAVNIAANGAFVGRPSDLFAMDDSAAYVRVAATAEISGFVEISEDESLAIARGIDLSDAGAVLFAPHVATGDGWTTEITLINLGLATVTSLTLFSDDGRVLARHQIDELKSGELIRVSLDQLTSGRPGLITGHLKVESRLLVPNPFPAINVAGFVSIGSTSGRFRTVSPLIARPGRQIWFAQIANGGPSIFFSGLAVVNASSRAAQVVLEAFRPDGTLSARRTLDVPSGGRIAGALASLMPEISEQVGGFLRLTSTEDTFAHLILGNFNLDFLASVEGHIIN